MQKINTSLLKQLTLLVALTFTVTHLFFKTPAKSTMLIVQICLGVVYLYFSVAEFSTKMAKLNMPFDRYFYLPLNLISHKAIKLGAFIIAASVLWVSSSSLVFLAGLLIIIIVVDMLVFALKVKQNIYYVSIFANYILISLEREKKVFAKDVRNIEYRYDIFFLTMADKKTFSVDVNRINKNQQTIFTEKFTQWALRNKLEFTEEAKAKLGSLLQL